MTSKRRKKHKPEQIVAKLLDADAMLNVGTDLGAVLQAREISEATLHRWRAQYGGVKSEPPKPRVAPACLGHHLLIFMTVTPEIAEIGIHCSTTSAMFFMTT